MRKKNKKPIVLFVVIIAALVVLFPIGMRLLVEAASPIRPSMTAQQLEERPSLTEMTDEYSLMISEVLKALETTSSTPWQQPSSEGEYEAKDPNSIFFKDYDLNGPQLVDGHEVANWQPRGWESKFPYDPALGQELFEASKPILQKYGFTFTEDELFVNEENQYWSFRAEDEYGAVLEVAYYGPLNEEEARMDFKTGFHVHREGNPQECTITECPPLINIK